MARKKQFAHLIKPMLIREPPAGLYPEPRVWMEAGDLEGFNAHFSFGFIRKSGPVHPMHGALIHPHDECLIFEGTNPGDILDLGAEVSVLLGAEGEEHVFTDPSVILVPKGLPHGPVTVRSLDRPIVHYSIGLGPDYLAETVTRSGAAVPGSKYGHLVKPMLTDFDTHVTEVGSGMGYEKTHGRPGVLTPARRGMGPGNGDEIVWLYGKNLEGFELNFTWGFYSRCGKWHRAGETHTHPEAEILCFVGLDPERPEYMGAELELAMGMDRERHVFNTPTVAICPAGFPHLPIVTRWVDDPYGFFVICLSGEHASPWVEAEETAEAPA